MHHRSRVNKLGSREERHSRWDSDIYEAAAAGWPTGATYKTVWLIYRRRDGPPSGFRWLGSPVTLTAARCSRRRTLSFPPSWAFPSFDSTGSKAWFTGVSSPPSSSACSPWRNQRLGTKSIPELEFRIRKNYFDLVFVTCDLQRWHLTAAGRVDEIELYFLNIFTMFRWSYLNMR